MAHRPRATFLKLPAIVCAAVVLGAASPCRFDLTGEKADRVFFLLGMRLEAPWRGAAKPADQLETFYCSERDTFVVFKRVVAGLVREQGLVKDVREETKQGCLSFAYSPSLAPAFDGCFRRGATGLDLALFARPGAASGDGRIAPADLIRRRALAYVAGAWARHRHDRTIVLTAGTSKADLLATLLKALGCTNVRVVRSLDGTPGSHTVHFDPTPEVAEWLQKRW